MCVQVPCVYLLSAASTVIRNRHNAKNKCIESIKIFFTLKDFSIMLTLKNEMFSADALYKVKNKRSSIKLSFKNDK